MKRFTLRHVTNRNKGILLYAAVLVTLTVVLWVLAPRPANAQIPPRVNTLQVDRPLAGPAVSPVDRLRQDMITAVGPYGTVDKRLLQRQISTRSWVSVTPGGPPTQLLTTQGSTRTGVTVLPAEPPTELAPTQQSSRPNVRVRKIRPERRRLRVPSGMGR
jgi:hypothetical protein